MGRQKNKTITCKQSCKYGFIYSNQQEYFRKLYHERKKVRLDSQYKDEIKKKNQATLTIVSEPIKVFFD